MSKISSIELRDKAKKLLEEAVKIEQSEYVKLGKILSDFYKNDKIQDVELKNAVNSFYAKKTKLPRKIKTENE